MILFYNRKEGNSSQFAESLLENTSGSSRTKHERTNSHALNQQAVLQYFS